LPATSNVKLTVATNEAGGYILSGCMAAPLTSTSPAATIPAVVGNPSPTSFNGATSAFGATATATAAVTPGVGTPVLQNTWGANYSPYQTGCTGLGSQIVKDTGPATLDTLTLTDGVNVSTTQAAADYLGTVSYQVTPSY
jgi:hypothetical protein